MNKEANRLTRLRLVDSYELFLIVAPRRLWSRSAYFWDPSLRWVSCLGVGTVATRLGVSEPNGRGSIYYRIHSNAKAFERMNNQVLCEAHMKGNANGTSEHLPGGCCL